VFANRVLRKICGPGDEENFTMKERDHSEDLEFDGKTILKGVLEK
jgi:hypothetical protein